MIQKIGNPKTENAGLGRDSRVASATIQEILPLSGICDAERRDGHKSPKIALLAAMMVAIMMGMMMPNSVWAQPNTYTPPYPMPNTGSQVPNYATLPAATVSSTPTTDVTPCTSCCPNTPWQPTTYDDFRLDNGCIIRVFYAWRIACGTWYEVQVLEIRTLNRRCNDYSKNQLFNEAHRAIITKNKMNFPLNPCITEYRVSSGSCWTTWDLYTSDGEDISIDFPCTGVTVCCEHSVKVCKTEDGKFIFTDLNTTNWWTGSCEDDGEIPDYAPDLPACHAICGWFKLSEYLPSVSGKAVPSTEGQRDVNSLTINQLENHMSFDIMNFIEGTQLRISIVDTYGNEVENINQTLNMFQNTVSTKKFNAGAYLYNIYIDGRQLYSGKAIFD